MLRFSTDTNKNFVLGSTSLGTDAAIITDDRSQATATLELLCPVCGWPLRHFGTGDYYVPGNFKMITPISCCSRCGAVYRNLDNEQIRSHYDAASYTDPRQEENYYRKRIKFFRFLVSLAVRAAGRVPMTCLDFGCSYGHLLHLLREKGCTAYGIELCDQARDLCGQNGLQVYSSIDELGAPLRFDLITMIDSLYYVSEPRVLLRQLRDRLTADGILMIRIANRNWILHLLKKVARTEYFGYWLGDAILGYTKPALEMLLRTTGYKILCTSYHEAGKNHAGWLTRMGYWIGSGVSRATLGKLVISPGIIVVAAKQS